MRKPVTTALAGIALAALLAAAPVLAQTPAPAQPAPAAPAPGAAPAAAPDATAALAADPLNTSAPYAFIMDGDGGLPLYCKQCDEAVIPASMSKLMVYYLVFERIKEGRLKLDDEFTVSEHAWRTGGAGTDGSTMFLKLGSKVKVDDLLHGAIIQSGNDACITLAEGIAGSEEAFAREMTAKAKELGLTHSTFANVTGLDDPGQRMSVHDIAMIGYHIIKDFPDHYKIFSETSFEWNGIRQPNRNPLLTELPGADGIKTGHLGAIGFGLAGSAVKDGKRRIIVLQGLASEKDRRMEGPRVMRSAFADFTTANLVAKDAQVAVANVFLGEAKTVPLVATAPVSVGMHMSAAKLVKSVVVYKGPLKAPLKKGDVVGDLIITAAGTPEIKVPVAVGADVKKLGLLGLAMVGLRGE